jgi:hypothetical protein
MLGSKWNKAKQDTHNSGDIERPQQQKALSANSAA